MAIGNTIGSSSTSEQTVVVGTLADAASIVVYADNNLASGEFIKAERSYDSGTNWRPAGPGSLVDDTKHAGRFTGPGYFRLVKSATATATQGYYDS